MSLSSSIVLQEGGIWNVTPDQLFSYGPYVLLGIIFLFALWWLWQWYSPAEPGDVLGMYSVVMRHYRTRKHRVLRGMLVDCTDKFADANTDRVFREFLYEGIMEAYESTPEKEVKERRRLLLAANWIFYYPLKRFCRVIALRHIDRKKHYLVQIYHVKKRLDSYGSSSEKPYWTWAAGLVMRGVINGVRWTIPEVIQRTLRFSGRRSLANTRWHFFCPDDTEEQDSLLPLPNLAYMVAMEVAQPYSKTASEVKVLRGRVSQAERGRDAALQESSLYATMQDTVLKMFRLMGVEGKTVLPGVRRFNTNDLMIVLGGVAAGGFGLNYIQPNNPLMVIIGCAFGGLIAGMAFGGR